MDRTASVMSMQLASWLVDTGFASQHRLHLIDSIYGSFGEVQEYYKLFCLTNLTF